MMDDQVIERLIRMETKMDVMLNSHTDHETRIRALESSRWPLSNLATVTGVFMALVAVVSLILTIWNMTR